MDSRIDQIAREASLRFRQRCLDAVARGEKNNETALMRAIADEQRHLATRIAKLEAVAAKLADALWGFDYNPDDDAHGYFCSGCDLDDDERPTSPHHDKDCKAAREALAALAALKEPING